MKSLIANARILEKLKEHSSLTLKEEDEDFKSILENASTPTTNASNSSRNNDLMTRTL